MKKISLYKILIGISALIVLILILIRTLAEPWMERKIKAAISEINSDYIVSIDRVDVSLFRSMVNLETIHINYGGENGNGRRIEGQIKHIQLKGISFRNLLMNKDIDIRELIIYNSSIKGAVIFSEEAKQPVLSPVNIRIGEVHIDTLDVMVNNISSAQTYSVKDGIIRIDDLRVLKDDTLTSGMIAKVDFGANEIVSVTADSMYTLRIIGPQFSNSTTTLTADSVSIHPNYEDYEFTSRHAFQTDRIEADFSHIIAHHIPVGAYLESGTVRSSFIEVGTMDIHVFRDKRKKFLHQERPTYQDLLYNYPGVVHIDSINII